LRVVLGVVALLLSGCHRRVEPVHPVIETEPPRYVWVCDVHTDQTVVCDAVPDLKAVPEGYDCVYQANGITACWGGK